MAGGGEALDVGDGSSYTRLNQKLFYINTGTNIAALSPTYPGMRVFSTDTSGGFTVDIAYERDAANAVWNTLASRLTILFGETAEMSTTPITDDTDFTPTANRRYFAYYTFPNTSSDPKWYRITKIEWKNGSAVAGTISSGVYVVDANPPLTKYMGIAAVGQSKTQSGTNTTQFTTLISNFPIKAGTTIGYWVQSSSASSRFKVLAAQPSNNYEVAGVVNGTLTLSNTNVLITSTNRIWLKLYYKGIV